MYAVKAGKKVAAKFVAKWFDEITADQFEDAMKKDMDILDLLDNKEAIEKGNIWIRTALSYANGLLISVELKKEENQKEFLRALLGRRSDFVKKIRENGKGAMWLKRNIENVTRFASKLFLDGFERIPNPQRRIKHFQFS